MEKASVSIQQRKRSFLKKAALGSVAIGCIAVYNLWDHVPERAPQLPVSHGDMVHSKSFLEDAYLKALETNLAGNWSQKYTSEPHLPGTNYGLVEWTRDKYEEYGLESEIDEYEIYVSYPNEHSLKLLSGEDDAVVYEAPLKEDVLEEDETTQGEDTVPTFLAYAANGNVTGEFVYCNYGTKQDFELLAAKGIDVKGKIAIVRYGSIFRGLKVKFAQENGAIGVLLYSDPGDDYGLTPENGYKTYPYGPARNPSSVQRGSVQFLSDGVGDPTTPGYASKPGCERKDPHNIIGKIPVLPISYREVKPILTKLNGYGESAKKVGGEDWVGELTNYSYSIGPNPSYKLNLYSDQIYNITPLWNVYGKIEGKNTKEVIILGNHRDAWIKGGAGDPNSGSAVMLEIARGFNELLKTGWKPERTIMFASWDGEEYALLGSTEFGENFEKEIQAKVVAYLNLDVATIGSILNIQASPTLHHILKKTAAKLPYPKGDGISLLDHFNEKRDGKIGDLGSGSDYTVFLDRLGVPSSDMSFSASPTDAVYQYHSNYDSYHWMSTFADPGFVYHNLMAKYLGLVALELSEKKVIDFKVSDYATKLSEYFESSLEAVPKSWFNETHSEIDSAVSSSLDANSVFLDDITGGYYREPHQCPYHDASKNAGKKHKKHPSHHGDKGKIEGFEALVHIVKKELKKFAKTAKSFDKQADDLQERFDNRDSLGWWDRIKLHFVINAFNNKLKYLERNFLYERGLNNRSWFRHIVYASGRYTGYEGQQFPGLIEAIEDKDIKDTSHWLSVILAALKRVNHSLK